MAFEPVPLTKSPTRQTAIAIKRSTSGNVLWLSRGMYCAFPAGAHVQPLWDAESSTLRLRLADSGLKICRNGGGYVISCVSLCRMVDITLGEWIDGVLTTDQDGNTVADFVIPRVEAL